MSGGWQRLVVLIVAVVVAEGVLVVQIVQKTLTDEVHQLHREVAYVCQETKEVARIGNDVIIEALHKAPLTLAVKCRLH